MAPDQPAEHHRQRADRIERVLRELHLRALIHEREHGEVPAPLRHAIGDFRAELARVRRAIRSS